MLLLQDARGEGMFVVGVEHGNNLLQNDGTVVEFFVHEMHRTTGNLHTVGEGLFLSLQSGESRQQRWMDIENAPGKLLHEPRREQPHVSCQAHKVNLVLPQGAYDLTIVRVSVFAFGRNYQRGESEAASGLNPASVSSV